MNKDTFKGIICGFLICALFLTGIPVSADTGTTLSDRIVAAITGNNANTQLSNLNTKINTLNTNITNLTTAVNNSGGGAGSGNIKAKYIGNSSCSSGPGFAVVTPYVNGNYTPSISFTADGASGHQYLGGFHTGIGNIYPITIYFQSSFSVTGQDYCYTAIYKYI